MGRWTDSLISVAYDSGFMRSCGLAFALALVASAMGQVPAPPNPQPVLTLKEAVKLAAQRNGTLRAQAAAVRGSGAAQDAAFAAFFPTLSPTVSYNRNNIYTKGTSSSGGSGGTGGNSQPDSASDGWNVGATASIRLLDSGQRNLTFKQAKRGLESAEATLTQTIRTTFFNVEKSYLEVLRAQELQKVQDSQAVRTETILKQTEKRVEVGDAAPKDILQAKADFLNSQVNVITSRTRTISNQAALKAIIGLGATETLPPLEAASSALPPDTFGTVDEAIKEGLANRPDLRANKLGIQAQEFLAKSRKLETGLTFAADASLGAFDRPRYGSDSLNFSLSFPLFDGGLSRANYREATATLEQLTERNIQAQREATSEIESSLASYRQGSLRLQAATAAVDAARLNYQAAERSRELGASDLIDVLTAQVSLVTAETNYIEALFDTLIAYRQVELATGRKLGLETP